MPPDAHVQGPARMKGFVTDLLRHKGALVEGIEPEGLEVLAPAPVQAALGVAELSRLGFGNTLPTSAQRVGIEGDWLGRLDRLLGSQGHWTRRVLPGASKAPADPERLLGHALVLDNATFRLLGVTSAWTRYLVLDFRASAVSDDKRDFMMRIGANLATGSLPDAVLEAITTAPDFDCLSPIGDSLDSNEIDPTLPDDADLPAMWERSQVLDLVARALPPRLDVALSPLLKGMRRRLVRGQDRLHAYHNDLHLEAMHRAMALPEGDAVRRREEQRSEAIQREYRTKLDDLARQYATRVTIEWVQTLELVMQVHRFAVQVRRRKGDRLIHLDWNPRARKLESLACEYTASVEQPRLVCDDALHIVVQSALGPCGTCLRPFCRACNRERCPKCRAAELSSPRIFGLERLHR
jgi:hypothetical protein